MIRCAELYFRRKLPFAIVDYIKQWCFETFQGKLDMIVPIAITNVHVIEQCGTNAVLIRGMNRVCQYINTLNNEIVFYDCFDNVTTQLNKWPDDNGIFVYKNKCDKFAFLVLKYNKLEELQHVLKKQNLKYVTLSNGKLAICTKKGLEIWK